MISIFSLIFLPVIAGLLLLLLSDKVSFGKEFILLLSTLVNLILAILKFNQKFMYKFFWAGFGIDFSIRLDHFSNFIILTIAVFCLLISLYSITFMKKKNIANQFYVYLLISLSMVNGAVLADNLVVMLFFWEGLLITLFAMIIIGNKNAFSTAVKAVVLVGVSDLCMIIGIGLTAHLSGTLTISKIHLPLDSLGALAFIMLMLGAIAKAGCMPFHSWIPDAAIDAPLPFMALFPAALEKLLGIYFLTRISFGMFALTPQSWMSDLLMIIGGVTILLAVMMALIQKDYKRLLSYHAISQVGYMILGIGTAVPAGMVGGLFHLLNNAMYKSCLFLTAGAVEHQTGTTDLRRLGGLAKKMPITAICFIIAGISISGVPPFNGFFSKELIYDGALERGIIFYIMAVTGSFFTAASFLKLGHSAFFGKLNDEHKNVKEAHWTMLVPIIVIALLCILFGVYNTLPLNKLIQPVFGEHLLENHNYSGFPTNFTLVFITILVLIAAAFNHFYGVKKSGSGLGAVNHIHYAPILHNIYDKAENRFFDPYNIGLKIINLLAKISWCIDKIIDWFYNTFIVAIIYGFSWFFKKLHTGNYSLYIVWSLIGIILIIFFAK